LVEFAGRGLVAVDLILVPEVGVGEYVIVHSGYAISRVAQEDVEQAFALMRCPEPETGVV
jgi:hydrogenase maturation factor